MGLSVRLQPQYARDAAECEYRSLILSPMLKQGNRFLIAALHVKALEERDTIMSIKAAVKNLPTDLDVMYEQTLERIHRLPPERANIGLLALLWVTHAKRPLDVLELQEALATKYTTGSFEIAQFYPEAVPEMNVILASVCGLLTVDSSGKVRLMRE